MLPRLPVSSVCTYRCMFLCAGLIIVESCCIRLHNTVRKYFRSNNLEHLHCRRGGKRFPKSIWGRRALSTWVYRCSLLLLLLFFPVFVLSFLFSYLPLVAPIVLMFASLHLHLSSDLLSASSHILLACYLRCASLSISLSLSMKVMSVIWSEKYILSQDKYTEYTQIRTPLK